MTKEHRRRARFAGVAVAAVLSLAALAWLRGPYVWIRAIWGVALVFVGVRSDSPRAAGACLVLASLAVGVGLAEVALGALRPPAGWPVYSEPYRARSDVMWVPVPGATSRSSRRFDGETVFDVVYTIGPDGLRIAPPVSGDGPHPAAVFFGCSFVYGEGVADYEALPYEVSLLTSGS